MTPPLDLPPLIGHRGAAAEAPENTLASIRTAAEAGARWVEFDVKLTADGIPILIHDHQLDRTTNGRGLVATTSFAEIRTLDAGSWFGDPFAGERVPTLDEAIELCRVLGLGMNIELKPCPGRDEDTVRAVLECLQAEGRALPERLLLSSFDQRSLAFARELAPEVPRGYLCGFVPRDWRTALQRHDCVTLHADHLRIGRRGLAALRAAGATVLLYTVNDPVRARRLLAEGATSIFTDRVGDLSRAIAEPTALRHDPQ